MPWYAVVCVLGGVLLLLLCCGGMLLVRACLLVITVQGQSMAPTLQEGDRVVAVRPIWRRWIRKDQIVLFRQSVSDETSDDSPLSLHIKRVVALAGEGYRSSTRPWGYSDYVTQVEQAYLWQIPHDHIFVCGDNREQSIDSCSWGPLPLRNVRGIVVKRLPPSPTFLSAHVAIAHQEDIA